MRVEELVNITRMSFWYPKLEDVTLESIRVDVGVDFAEDLFDEFIKMGNPFKSARKLLRKYPNLRNALRKAIKEWGAVFIRGDLASPKDVCYDMYHSFDGYIHGVIALPGTNMNACVALSPESAVALLVSSERVIFLGDPSIIWLRRPAPLSYEVRVFVHDGVPRLISWYYVDEGLKWGRPCPYKHENVLKRLKTLTSIVRKRLGLNSFAVDVGYVGVKNLKLIEVTPFPTEEDPYLVDPILFEKDFWCALKKAIKEDAVIVRYATREIIVKEGMVSV